MNSLPLFHRIAGQPVIVVGAGDAAAAKARLVERAGGEVVGFADVDARLAFVALDEPEDVVADLRVRGVLVNVVDRPELCDFTVPSLLERGPVLVAVGTGGVSAGLAKALRMRLETILPQTLEQLANALGKARARLRLQWPDPALRRKQIDAALTQGGPLDPLREFAEQALDGWLAAANANSLAGAGTLIELRLESDDPDDLTLREARYLANADLIVHDPAVAPAILTLARADAARRLPGEDLPATGVSLKVVLTRAV